MTFLLQKTLFGFLVMIYEKVSDVKKSSYGKFGLARPRFHVTSHLKGLRKTFQTKYKYVKKHDSAITYIFF